MKYLILVLTIVLATGCKTIENNEGKIKSLVEDEVELMIEEGLFSNVQGSVIKISAEMLLKRLEEKEKIDINNSK